MFRARECLCLACFSTSDVRSYVCSRERECVPLCVRALCVRALCVRALPVPLGGVGE